MSETILKELKNNNRNCNNIKHDKNLTLAANILCPQSQGLRELGPDKIIGL